MQWMARTWLIVLGLAVVIALAYWRAPTLGFVALDDPLYVTDNAHVQAGLTEAGVRWAFVSGTPWAAEKASNWHPLTWLSHMVDVQLFGLNPAAFHVVNVILHALNSILLFLLLERMTLMAWPSALVAACFALHPVHVESVAWISERKDVLSTLFGLVAIWFYVAYVKSDSSRKALLYTCTALLLILGLMTKPMLVTLPCVLLLLDYWPLARVKSRRDANRPSATHARSWGRLIVEKTPLFTLSALSSVVTYAAQSSFGAKSARMPLETSAANAIMSYVRYLGKAIWPLDLSPYYPFPGILGQPGWKTWQIAAALATLLVITGVAIWQARRRPYLIVGWLWFAGTLIPVCGLIQVGAQGMADRYLYVPSIGLFIMVAFGIAELLRARRGLAWPMAAASILVIAAWLMLAQKQVSIWKDTDSLYTHALKLDDQNWVAHFNYGVCLHRALRFKDAMQHYQKAERMFSAHPDLQFNLGQLKLVAGRDVDARRHFDEALAIDPNHVNARHHLAVVLWRQGNRQLARQELDRAIAANPGSADELRRIFVEMTR